MHVNGREFLLGELHDWPQANKDIRTWFMVRSSVWLRKFLDVDPVLKFQDFDIRRTQDASFTAVQYLKHQMALEPQPGRNCTACHFNITLDPELQVDGYETYSNGLFSLLFLPKDSEIAHGFRCSLNRDAVVELESCSVVVVYPYATNIVLTGYRYQPGTVADYGRGFAAIAARMLEIVMCIDITGQPMLRRSRDISMLLQEHPTLSDCELYVGG